MPHSTPNSAVSVTANGQRVEIQLPCRLTDFLYQSGWKPTQVVVELNGNVIPRAKLPEIQLHEGDQLEVIVPVAGG